ncbi:hypothetical protein SCHPADRAFT_858627 [Schizopora paradoxa]|uniref:Nudix hydrolase domain-containing protein n=1 Tax=Schizopora paradoxa TaxID=27342 RepID=A0A0H2RBI1_9AGAM|nr:hypothetical protein SCHPADRAFT_858627 [Schizopora paradoxa]
MNTVDSSLFGLPEEILQTLTDENQKAITRLLNHKPVAFDFTPYPQKRLAAVLVLLYEKAGRIQVLLTTRSKTLRSHPGQTALPGGKCDVDDENVLSTALREAYEEVGLPLDYQKIHPLCILRPFVSLYGLLVSPVVCFLSDASLVDNLVASESEVERIFEHPLEAIINPNILNEEGSSEVAQSLLAEKGSDDWPYADDLHNTTDSDWIDGSKYRMHRFRSKAYAIKGLTSDILIKTAEVAYGQEPTYDRWAPGQFKSFLNIASLMEMFDRSRERYTSVRADTEGSRSASQEHLHKN